MKQIMSLEDAPRKKLSEIADILNGYAFKSKYYAEKGVRIIRIANVQDGYIVDDTPCFYPVDAEEAIDKYRLLAGDLLISLTGNVGRIGILPTSMLPAALNQRVCCLRIDENIVDRKYLFYCLRRHQFIRDCVSASRGVAQLNLSTKWLADYEIPLPDLCEQHRIVARIEELFSELDNGVETLRKTKQQLAVYRQAVLETAFRECALKENVQFGDILSEKPRNGYSPKGVDHQTKYRNLTLTATTSGYFKDNCFKYIDINIDDDSYLWVKHNDILIQRANTIEYVGTAVLYQGEDNRYVYPDLMMKCHTKDGINPQFVIYQLQSRMCKTHFREHATGTSGSMPKINQQTVMTAPIVMTSLEEQERIVKQIEERLSVCDSIEKTVDTALQQAEAMRQSILKQAFEGKL